MRAQPATTCTPALRSSEATPPVSLPTTPSFQACVTARSMLAASARMPSVDMGEPLVARRTRSYASAAWIKALDGMQPMFRQVPPGAMPSTSMVATPSCAARIAAT